MINSFAFELKREGWRINSKGVKNSLNDFKINGE
jgi:hypothetical protein